MDSLRACLTSGFSFEQALRKLGILAFYLNKELPLIYSFSKQICPAGMIFLPLVFQIYLFSFRVSFCGGGSDIPSFYEKYGGCVLSTTIRRPSTRHQYLCGFTVRNALVIIFELF
jgi:hypothetical protein